MGSIGSDTAEIPVIDIRPSNTHAPRQLLEAATRNGFVFVENSGLDAKDVDHMFDLSKAFFSSSIDIKEEVAINSNKAGANVGWLSRGVEKLDPATQKRPDVKEALNIAEPFDGNLQQPMPKPLKAHAQTILEFQNRCLELCQTILELFAVALDLEKDWFTARHSQPGKRSGTVFRLLYYPKVETYEDGVDIRAGAHSDFGSITLLFQQHGQPGLEIKTPSGEWVPVPVDPHSNTYGTSIDETMQQHPLPILVNIGDLLDDWTGGLLKSTVHRVIFPQGGGEDRYSMAYFCQPLDDALLEAVPSKLVQAHVERTGRSGTRNGTVITARDHLMERLAATYTLK
ncbi:hypothetical protein LTR56_006097 [Elasticomyces elasticus]|nr:hypothetical protein LTR56_006097 [Elasticomyces elasticus]KAK3667641.1 hypothetical protein LTR22_001456 [Elasticomyces elasticus]KAK4928403.1 hypothetical protein LTR49_004810 [Elasticomyces elasticus]KAK5767204.1 hypothetical protein LTS12_002662 [Elasticomyces elasticus]